MLQMLDAYIDRMSGLEPEEKDRLFEEAKHIIGSDIWIPNPHTCFERELAWVLWDRLLSRT